MKLPKHLKLFTAIALLSFNASNSLAQEHDIMVVANIGNTSVKLNKVDIRNLFMGNASDVMLEPVSLPPETLARAVFNTKVIGLTESRIQSYWSQMRFSGRSRPPKELPTVDELITYVANHKDTVAFVPADAEIPSHLTVIYSTYKM